MSYCEICKKPIISRKCVGRPPKRYCEKCRKRKVLEYRREYMRNYWRTHKNARKKNMEQERNRRVLYRLKVLNHYSNCDLKCACCGETHIEFLELDHVNGDGNDNRKKVGYGSEFYSWLIKNNFPEKLFLQVLCANCNRAKGKNKQRFCPVHHPNLYKK